MIKVRSLKLKQPKSKDKKKRVVQVVDLSELWCVYSERYNIVAQSEAFPTSADCRVYIKDNYDRQTIREEGLKPENVSNLLGH